MKPVWVCSQETSFEKTKISIERSPYAEIEIGNRGTELRDTIFHDRIPLDGEKVKKEGQSGSLHASGLGRKLGQLVRGLKLERARTERISVKKIELFNCLQCPEPCLMGESCKESGEISSLKRKKDSGDRELRIRVSRRSSSGEKSSAEGGEWVPRLSTGVMKEPLAGTDWFLG